MKLSFLLAALPLAQAETILGVYIFHRHGDRTPKSTKPVNLTTLGASQVYNSGSFYRDRYISTKASHRIAGISGDVAVPSQVNLMSPEDAMLQSSAAIFMQALYPPLGIITETLANGTEVHAPMGGRQYLPVNVDDMAASNKHSESNAMLQSESGCEAALASTEGYFQTSEYKEKVLQTKDFYHGLLPVLEPTFDSESAGFKNAYTIWDLVNVNRIHNETYLNSDLLDDSAVAMLKFLANLQQWNLAYNASDPIRAIAGSLLAGHILEAFEPIIKGDGSAPKASIQFGAYATFLSFFGLAELTAWDNIRFRSIVDYASSMVFELYRNNLGTIMVRMYFANGPADSSELVQTPMFASGALSLTWSDFEAGMNKFAVKDQAKWCDVCGNKVGICATGTSTKTAMKSKGGVSPVVAGVIGALVTLAVIGGVQALIMLVAGLKVVKKSMLRNMISVEKLEDS